MRRFVFLVLSVILLITASACGKEVSSTSIRQDYACSYELVVQEDSTLSDVASATMPEDLHGNDFQTLLDKVTSWKQAIEERNHRFGGEVKKGDSLQIPARCNQTPGSSEPAPQR